MGHGPVVWARSNVKCVNQIFFIAFFSINQLVLIWIGGWYLRLTFFAQLIKASNGWLLFSMDVRETDDCYASSCRNTQSSASHQAFPMGGIIWHLNEFFMKLQLIFPRFINLGLAQSCSMCFSYDRCAKFGPFTQKCDLSNLLGSLFIWKSM